MILWVDDNHELRRAVTEHLKAAGHRVAEAGSAEEALEIVKRLGPDDALDLLLTDFRLPGRTGLDLAATLRDMPATSLLPVLLVTSHATSDDLIGWSGDSEFAVLQKPFDLVDLYAAVSTFLAGETPRTGFRPSRPAPSNDAPTPSTASAKTPSDAGRSSREPGSSEWLRLALAVGLSLAVLAIAWPWLGPADSISGTAPSLPDAPTEDVRRSGVIQGLDPFGPIAGVPGHFAWRPVTSAVHYRLQVYDVAGKTLWQSDSDAAEMDLPTELAGKLLPLAAYYWQVEALDEAGTIVAASDSVRFRILEPETDRSSP